MNIRKSKLLGAILGVILFILLIAGMSYAWITWQSSNTSITGITECFDIDYTKGGNISNANVILFDESEIKNNNNITIKNGMALTNMNVQMNSNCNIEAYLTINLNVETLNDAFISGDSIGALKYVVAKYSKTTYPTVSTEGLKDKSFEILSTGSVNTVGNIKLLEVNLNGNTSYDYLIAFYIDGNLANNDAGSTTFSAKIEGKLTQGNVG